MSGMNQQQKNAASHPKGNAIVLAGPGTGKTSTLIARHAFLRAQGINSEHILVSTFTQKAAEELKNRLGNHVKSSSWIGTFHSICLRLLRRFNEAAGLKKSFKILDTSSQKELLLNVGIAWDTDDGDLIDIIARWKDSMMSPDAAMADAYQKGNNILKDAAEHYTTYETELKKRGDLDFSDLVAKSLSIIQNSTEVKTFIKERILHALVDEFQDVNRVQVEFLQALADCGTTIWAVADDDQALYGWRGGNVRYSVNFNEYFKGSTTYTLTMNYRCDPAIIAAANISIANNRHRVRKTLQPARQHKKGTCVRIRSFKTEKEEADWIALTLSNYIKRRANPSDIAILLRTSSVAPFIQQALEAHNVPFTLTGTQSFWELPEVSAIAEALVSIQSGVPGKSSRFKGVFDLINTMKGSTPSETATSVGRLIGDQPLAGSTAERSALWSDACEAAASIAATFNDASAFTSHINEMASRISSNDNTGVAITSIHSSKGLEWKHVIIAGAEAALMPHHRSDDLEEERRLFYVALTRSKGSVDITFSKFRFGKSQIPSPYLTEISKAPSGAVIWAGGMPQTTDEPKSNPTSGNTETPQNTGKPKVYRRRGGGKSLIPPEEL